MKRVFILISIYLLINPVCAIAVSKHKHRKHTHYKREDKAAVEQTSDTLSPPDTNTASSENTTGEKINEELGQSESVAKVADTSTPPAEEKKETSWLDNLSGTLAFTTNYMFRGISLSEDNPAVQGGLTYTFNGNEYGQPYLNLWGSNANYSAPDGKRVTSEFDTIAGWLGKFPTSVLGKFAEDFSYNINYDRYNYPGARKANYNELNTLWIYKILQLGYSYTGNYSGTHASGSYYNGTLTFDIPAKYFLGFEGVTIAGEMGHYSLAKAAGNSYNDYSLTFNKKMSDKYAWAVMGTGTNGRAKLPPFDGNQIVGTINAFF